MGMEKKGTFFEFIDILFGHSDVQLALAKSEDKRFKSYIGTIENVRLLMFPVNVGLVLIAAILIGFGLLAEMSHRFVSFLYMFSIDCGWLSPERFGITREDYTAEFNRLKD